MKTLIIKLGASGDVLRTTPLLHILNGDVFWVTKGVNVELLPKDRLAGIFDFKDAKKLLEKQKFDLILSLDDEFESASLASSLSKTEIIGSYLDDKRNVIYTDSSAEWFDMGIISKHGIKMANELKKKNIKTYQEIIFKMLNQKFTGEEYILGFTPNKKIESSRKIIGIENRAGERWPSKKWNKYEKLASLLTKDGYEVIFFSQKDTICQYIEDISQCSVIITGDTLAMHIALALKIKVVAIFICTSPTEIYGYNRMTKVVSPLLELAFYKREYIHEAVDAISLDTVYNSVISMVK